MVGGPAFAGLLLARWGAVGAYLFDLASFIAALFFLASYRPPWTDHLRSLNGDQAARHLASCFGLDAQSGTMATLVTLRRAE
jgi:hypothetical protein